MNAVEPSRRFRMEVEKLVALREQGAINDEEYQWARLAVLREHGAISDEEYHEARRRFRMEVERLVKLREQGAITDEEYQDRRLRCAMRLETVEATKAEEFRRKARLRSLAGPVGFVLVCIATAAATWNLILYNRDPYSNNPFIIPTMLIAFLFGPVALAMLISALNRMTLSSQPVPWQDRALVIVGIILAGVGAVEVGYLVLMGMAANLAV